ncbi:hypothetical protein LD39_13760, partial [Halobacillus sp. BBL2006]
MVVPYKHEPFTDFSVEENRKALEAAIKQVESDLGKDYPLVIGGERIMTDDKIKVVNPANKKEVIGYVSKANQDLAEKAHRIAD